MRRFQFLVLTLVFTTAGACGKSEKSVKNATDAAPTSEPKKDDSSTDKRPTDQPAVVVKKDGESKPAVVITKEGPKTAAPGGGESSGKPQPRKANGKKFAVKKDVPPIA